MSVVDIVLILLTLVFAASGYRQGFVVGALSFAGFFVGALIGLQIGPLLGARFTDEALRVVVALISIFGLAVLGQALAGWLGSRIRHAITNRRGQIADDIGGALVSVLAVLLVAWLVAVPLADSSLPWLASAVRNSALVKGINRAMPDQARALSDSLRDTVDTRGFPDVFGDLTPTRAREVTAPDPRLSGSRVVATSQRSVVKVLGTAPSCSRRIEGSGFVFASRRVMTNAHVVAGTKSVTVEVQGDRYSARVVVYDPQRDLAVLYVPGLSAPAMRFSTVDAQTGTDAIVLGFPLDGPYDARPARVRDMRDITGPNIYDDGDVTREIYTIYASVRSGNSGGPLIALDGTVLGIIFAAAADDENTGFAVTAEEAGPVAVAGRNRTESTSTGRCA